VFRKWLFDGSLGWPSTNASLAEQIRKNTAAFASGCGESMALVHKKKADAIPGKNAFRNLSTQTIGVIEPPEDLQVHRSTVISAVAFSKNRKLAKKLIHFLVS
jgi:hypothetical protein